MAQILVIAAILAAVAIAGAAMLLTSIERKLDLLIVLFRDLLCFLEHEHPRPTPTAFAITQVPDSAQSWPPTSLYDNSRGWYTLPQGATDMSSAPIPQILGITLGNTGTFNTLVTAPPGATFPSGTTFAWSSSDPLTSLTPSGDTTQVAVATTTSDTATSFVLICTATFTPAGGTQQTETATATVPLTAPVSTTPTAFAINQLS